jgi:hypothetical protein
VTLSNGSFEAFGFPNCGIKRSKKKKEENISRNSNISNTQLNQKRREAKKYLQLEGARTGVLHNLIHEQAFQQRIGLLGFRPGMIVMTHLLQDSPIGLLIQIDTAESSGARLVVDFAKTLASTTLAI